MKLNPRVKEQVVCKVISAESMGKIALIDIEGIQSKVNKVLGFTFNKGEYALLKTFKSSDESLVVAMNREERIHYFMEVKKIKERHQKDKQASRVSTRIIPVNADITDKDISEKIKFLFQPNLSSNQFNEVLQEVFSIVATQDNESHGKLKEHLYEKADVAINRNFILNKSFREAHDFMTIMVSRIETKADHLHFFRAVNFFLKRLNRQVKKGHSSPEKIEAIFKPIYKNYVNSFSNKFLDMWVNKINEEN